MKKMHFWPILLLLGSIACSSAETKDPKVSQETPQKTAVASGQQIQTAALNNETAVLAKVASINEALASLKIDFQYNKATLPAEGSTENMIQSAAATIQKITSEIPKGYSLSVVGHASKVGGDVYNRDLAQRRAQTVTSRISKAGVVASTLKTTNDGTSRDMMAVTFELRKK